MFTALIRVNFISLIKFVYQNYFYSCLIQKKVLPLQRETQRRDVCASAEGFADILKRRLLRSVLTLRNLANFRNVRDLATIDVLRDIDYPSCAYFGTSFAYIRMRTRVP